MSFETIVKVVISPIFFSLYFYYVYRKVPDFHELVSYPATFLKVFIYWRSCPVELLKSVTWIIISSANKNILTSSICIPLISFSHLIA